MVKNIVVPTDFTVYSLILVKTMLSEYDDEKINIILVFEAEMNDSITELLYFSKNEMLKHNLNDNFKEALEIIQNKFEHQINSIRIEPFSGFTKNSYLNLLEALKVDLIYLPKSNQLSGFPKRIKNIIKYSSKSEIQCNWVTWNEQSNQRYESNDLSNLFSHA